MSLLAFSFSDWSPTLLSPSRRKISSTGLCVTRTSPGGPAEYQYLPPGHIHPNRNRIGIAQAGGTHAPGYYEGVKRGGDSIADGELMKVVPLNDKNCGVHLNRGSWALHKSRSKISLDGTMIFKNTTAKNEIFVPEIDFRVHRLLGSTSVKHIKSDISVIPNHPDAEYSARADEYWFGYILVAEGSTEISVSVELTSQDEEELGALEVCWLECNYLTYGPHGRRWKSQHVCLPVGNLPGIPASLPWRMPSTKYLKSGENVEFRRLALKTHLLSHLDDPVDVIMRYAGSICQEGDIVTIGESPLAIMQGRIIHPETLRPGFVAKFCCRFFQPTSSLATACGMQALVDTVGSLRVLMATLVGGLLQILLRKKGMFYRLAGKESGLIDDITGTIPPYDQFILPGPVDSQGVCDRVRRHTGLHCAVVDVNDKTYYLGMKILASSAGCPIDLMQNALIDNPSGNADERTPLVLIRPGL